MEILKAEKQSARLFICWWQLIINTMTLLTGIVIFGNYAQLDFESVLLTQHLVALWGFALIIGSLCSLESSVQAIRSLRQPYKGDG